MRGVQGLARACHPMPCVAVTAFVAAFGVSAGLGAGRVALLAAAVLAGQLTVGWCNDYVDAGRDVAAGRRDKPIAAGAVRPGTVRAAMLGAAGGCVGLSLALGARPAVVHLVAVASALAYNRTLKFTVASPLPYLVSFGLVPPVLVAAALPGAPPPRPAVVVGAGLLGVSAHFANTVRDTAADAATGVRGLPQRLGPRTSVAVSAGLVAVVALLLLVVTPRTPVTVTLLAASAALAGASLGGAVFRRAARSALAFRLNVAAAGLVVLGFVASGSALTLAR